MSEQEPGKPQRRRPTHGPVSSPRAYFGRASRAATGALRAGISEVTEGAAAAPKGPLVYVPGDPALRLFAGFALPLEPTTPLTGAVATLTGIRDGEHERLFIDLGTSLVRVAPQRDIAAGMLRLTLSRTQSAETYSTLLSSLRYVNDAPAPTHGERRITLEMLDASGEARRAAAMQFSVGEAPGEASGEAPEDAAARADAPEAAALAALAPGAGAPPPGEPAPAAPAETPRTAPAREADKRIVFGETVSFVSGSDYAVFWWPRRLPERARRVPPAPGPAPEAAAGSFFSAGGTLYRLFESPRAPAAPANAAPATPALPSAPAAAPQAASALLSAQTPPAANDRAPVPRRAANDAVWVPGRGAPPPGFAPAPMLRLEDIFGSDMQDAIARRLIDMRIASAGG
mgnify:CR=1 FL=1